MADENDDYEAYEDVADIAALVEENKGPAGAVASGAQAIYTGVRISGFKDFLLRPELLKAIGDASFEHPSQVQHDCLPNAMIGDDILCQAKSGMGKTAVFVLASLNHLQDTLDECGDKVRVLVIGHSRELAQQHEDEFLRFSKHMPEIHKRIGKVIGGVPVESDIEMLKKVKPWIVVGTPGRIFDLVEQKALDPSGLDTFIIDECDRLLEDAKTRGVIVQVFVKTRDSKQTMMFTATLPDKMREICKKFLRPGKFVEVSVDGDQKLTLHGLEQHYMKIQEDQKIATLFKMLDENHGYNQVVIFVSSAVRVETLTEMMIKHKFPTYGLSAKMATAQRLETYEEFKKAKRRFLVATDLFGRGVDVQAVNLVINFDCPRDIQTKSDAVLSGADQYLHRIGRAGRFGTRGVAVTFISSAEDAEMMNAVQRRFEVVIKEVNVDNMSELTKSLAATASV